MRYLIITLLIAGTAQAESIFDHVQPRVVAPPPQVPAVNLPYPNQVYVPPVLIQQPSTDYVDRAYQHETQRAIIQNLDSNTRLQNQKYWDNWNKPAEGKKQ